MLSGWLLAGLVPVCEALDPRWVLVAFFLRGFLLACGSYHAIAWYVEHSVGRGHGGENFAAAVVEFLP